MVQENTIINPLVTLLREENVNVNIVIERVKDVFPSTFNNSNPFEYILITENGYNKKNKRNYLLDNVEDFDVLKSIHTSLKESEKYPIGYAITNKTFVNNELLTQNLIHSNVYLFYSGKKVSDEASTFFRYYLEIRFKDTRRMLRIPITKFIHINDQNESNY